MRRGLSPFIITLALFESHFWHWEASQSSSALRIDLALISLANMSLVMPTFLPIIQRKANDGESMPSRMRLRCPDCSLSNRSFVVMRALHVQALFSRHKESRTGYRAQHILHSERRRNEALFSCKAPKAVTSAAPTPFPFPFPFSVLP